MITKHDLIDTFVGKKIVDALIETLYNQDPDFPETHRTYLSAIAKLHQVLGDAEKRNIQKYVVAIEQKCASSLYHAGMRGLKMNYDHFLNPMAPNCTWKEVDYDDYLMPHIADQLPLFEVANRYTTQFEKQLPADLADVKEAVISYETALECCGMKLAHYYGYLAGNELLYFLIPGYHADTVLDIRYSHMLEQYFGRPLDKSQWEGFINLKTWNIAPLEEFNAQEIFLLREDLWKSAR